MADSKAKKHHSKKKPGDDVSEGEESGSDASSDSVQEKGGESGSNVQMRKSGSQIGKGLAKGRTHIDREEYLQAHRDLTFDKNQLQIKNNILHRRLADYYKKRKLDHVLKPLENSMDLEEKYQQKLLSYVELKEKEERELADIKVKLQEVTSLYETQEEKANEKFKALQDHERNTGSGLIYAMKGKPISDKTVHRFLSLQKSKSLQIRGMTLRYIRVRNAVMEQEAIIRGLEKIAPGLYVAGYEQLRVEKTNYTSKIEERDDELIRNRIRCTERNQMLAHIREKMNHTDEVIDSTECDLGDAELDYQKAREEVNIVKTQRDRLRILTENERLKAGLITKRSLLHDFQDSLDLVVKMRDKKAYLQSQIEKYNMELRAARKCIASDASTSEDWSYD